MLAGRQATPSAVAIRGIVWLLGDAGGSRLVWGGTLGPEDVLGKATVLLRTEGSSWT